jgi:hypothetical protein
MNFFLPLLILCSLLLSRALCSQWPVGKAVEDVDLQPRAMRFEWKATERSYVNVYGSWNQWTQPVILQPQDSRQEDCCYTTVHIMNVDVNQPQAQFQYKFVVGGQWMHDATKQTVHDPQGNINNVFSVQDMGPVDH